MGKTRVLFKKIGDNREDFMQRWLQHLTEAEEIKKCGKNTQKNYALRS